MPPRTLMPFLYVGFDQFAFNIFRSLAESLQESEPDECAVHKKPIMHCAHRFLCLLQDDPGSETSENRCIQARSAGTDGDNVIAGLMEDVKDLIDGIEGERHLSQKYNFAGIDGGTPFSRIWICVIADLRSAFTRKYLPAFLNQLLTELFMTDRPGRGRNYFYVTPFLVVRSKNDRERMGEYSDPEEIRKALEQIRTLSEDDRRFFSSVFLFDGETNGGNDLWSKEELVTTFFVEAFRSFAFADVVGDDIRFLFQTNELLFRDINKPVYRSLGIKVVKYPLSELISKSASKGLLSLYGAMVKDDGRDVGEAEFFNGRNEEMNQTLTLVSNQVLSDIPTLRQTKQYNVREEPEQTIGRFKTLFQDWQDTIKTDFEENKKRIRKSNQKFCKASEDLRKDIDSQFEQKMLQFPQTFKNGVTLGLRFLQKVRRSMEEELSKQPSITWMPRRPDAISFDQELEELERLLHARPNLKAFSIYAILHLIVVPWVFALSIAPNSGFFSLFLVRLVGWFLLNLGVIGLLHNLILAQFRKKMEEFTKTAAEKAQSLLRDHREILEVMVGNLQTYWKSRLLDHFSRHLEQSGRVFQEIKDYLETLVKQDARNPDAKDPFSPETILAALHLQSNLFLRYLVKEEDVFEAMSSADALVKDQGKDQIDILREAFTEEKYLENWYVLFPDEFVTRLTSKLKAEMAGPIQDLAQTNFQRYLRETDLQQEVESVPIPLFYNFDKVPASPNRPDDKEHYLLGPEEIESLTRDLPINRRYSIRPLRDVVYFWRPLHNLCAGALRLYQGDSNKRG